MDLSQLPTEEIEKLVQANQLWLEKIIDFVEEVTHKYGERVAYQQHNCHTYSKHELMDVCGFSFMTEGSFSMYGGDKLIIWYCPPRKKKAQRHEVLHLDWHETKRISVENCANKKTWWPALERLMKNKKKIFPTPKQKEEQEKQVENKKQDERHETIRRKELLEQAQRMRL